MADNIVYSAIKKAKTTAVIQQILGSLITIFCALMTSAGIATSGFRKAVDVVMVTFFAVLTVLGILLIAKGYKKEKLIKTFYDYSSKLASDPQKSVDLLASSTGATMAVTTKNISDMISLGFFPGAYLDTAHNRLIFPENAAATPFPSVQNTVNNTVSGQVKYITVQCRGCGATNKIIAGSVGECEFCGSQISDK